MVHRSLMLALQALAITSWLHLPCVAAFHTPRANDVSTRPRSITQSSHPRPFPLAITNRHQRSFTMTYSQPAAENESNEEKELTPEAIGELIEVSFLQSCLQLSQGYIDVLKLFIVAVKAGYEKNLPLSELHKLVEECPVNSAGRDLMKEEKELRLEWMRVVYELLNALNPDATVDATAEDVSDVSNARISQVVEAMLSIDKTLKIEEQTTGGKNDAAVALITLSVEEALERSESLSKLNDSTTDPMEKAFLTNDIRVALVTFRALDEEEICMQDSAGRTVSSGASGPPRPSIPGT